MRDFALNQHYVVTWFWTIYEMKSVLSAVADNRVWQQNKTKKLVRVHKKVNLQAI